MGGYAATAVESAGHDVRFIDTTVNGWNFETTYNDLIKHTPDLLCVNAVYLWENTGKLFELLIRLKANGFTGHINLFGFYSTLAWETLLDKVSAVDSIAVGECENTLAELACKLGNEGFCADIKGLAIRGNNGNHLFKPRMPEKNPDNFGIPQRAKFKNMASETTVSILASRGCYNHCSFCLVPPFYNGGPLWRGRSPENIINEIKQMIDQGYRDFYFADANFIGPGEKGKRRIMELMDMIKPLNITFGMETRSNDLDEEVMEKLVSAGFTSLLIGIESGSSSVLGNLQKGASLNTSERAIQLCRDFSVEPEVGFLMFVPDSTLEDLEHNLAFLEKNNLLDKLERTANLLSHCQIVLMGTSGYTHFQNKGRLKPKGIFDFEGDVEYSDPRVKWMSELIVHACLYVLRDTSRPESPIFWQKNGQNPICAETNDYLVNLFKKLLMKAKKASLPSLTIIKQEIEQDIKGFLN